MLPVAWAAIAAAAAGKEEPQLRRLLNENEEVARQRDSLKKRLELMQRAAEEILHFRV
jgi:dynamin 1-like protein